MSGDGKILAALAADGIAKQKMHVMMLVDTSRSMRGERIRQVNEAIADIHKYLLNLQSENANVDFYMSILTFSNEAVFLPGYKGVNVNDMTPPTLNCGGYSNLHCAYEKLGAAMQKESLGGMMPDFGGVAPIILLLTDGHPTKDSEKHLQTLKKLPWFKAALRYGVAIELNDDRTMKVLEDFTEDKDCVISCFDASMLARIIQIIVMTASKVKSQNSVVNMNKSSVPKRGAKKVAASTSKVQCVVKQERHTTLAELDDWEW